MKIYLLGIRRQKPLFLTTKKELSKAGHKINADWLKISAEKDAIEFEKSYERNMKAIKQSDVIIADVSNISSGVGFQIATALKEKKPVLALFNINSKTKPSATLRGSSYKNRLLTYQEYSDQKDFLKKTTNYLREIKKKLDTKFILIIPPEIDRYLEWASKEKRMHKAQIVREAVEKIMKRDKDWKKFLKEESV